MAERLGRALQKLPQRFESARDLNKKTSNQTIRGFFYVIPFVIILEPAHNLSYCKEKEEMLLLKT